jgi:hypothetical protein
MAVVRIPTKPGNVLVLGEGEDAQVLRAAYERSLDELQALVEAYPELATALSSTPQQRAYRSALAFLAESGRRVRR